jgi:alpha-beta hydrolase superfamily lysophospholipase
MGEHALRYDHVAGFFLNAGFHVYANDHRGHGRTAKSRDALGDFGAGGWDALVSDVVRLTELACRRESQLPIVLLGHSMGSFAAQQYMLDHSKSIAGVILSGSVSVDKLTFDSSRSADLTALNRDFEPARTPYDWLSRDPAVVDAYVADPLCGFGVKARSLQSMSAGLSRLRDAAELQRIRPNLPIYIVAGDHDPLNRRLEWLRPLAERYRAARVADVTEKYYAGGRHEMLNETNRDEVLKDLLSWARRVIA